MKERIYCDDGRIHTVTFGLRGSGSNWAYCTKCLKSFSKSDIAELMNEGLRAVASREENESGPSDDL